VVRESLRDQVRQESDAEYSAIDHSVTDGHLCIKGRFGYDYVQNLEDDLATTPVDIVLRSVRGR